MVKLKAPPQDWELFKFEILDAQEGSVRIKNVWGTYVHKADVGGTSFACDHAKC